MTKKLTQNQKDALVEAYLNDGFIQETTSRLRVSLICRDLVECLSCYDKRPTLTASAIRYLIDNKLV